MVLLTVSCCSFDPSSHITFSWQHATFESPWKDHHRVSTTAKAHQSEPEGYQYHSSSTHVPLVYVSEAVPSSVLLGSTNGAQLLLDTMAAPLLSQLAAHTVPANQQT